MINLENYDQVLIESCQRISKCEFVGFDAEYRHSYEEGKNIPSYMQVSLADRCYVYNLQKLLLDIRTLPYVLMPITRVGILKVGHSCSDDVQNIITYIKRTFNLTLPPASACIDLERVLFNCDKLNKPSLSDICFRFFGKHMRKKL